MKVRIRIAILCTIVNAICYADRSNIGVAISGFIDDKVLRGVVFSAFFYGYISNQLISGWIATKYGAKIVLTVGIIVWTTSDISTIFAASSVPLLVLARIIMGCGEAVTFPCLHRLASTWFPGKERARLVSLVSGGSDLGTIVSLLVSPFIMSTLGWQAIFLVFGILSVAWVIVFTIYGSSYPEESRHITTRELQYIQANREYVHDSLPKKVPWKVILFHPAICAIYISHICFNYGWYVLLNWLPQYFQEKMHIDLSKNPLFSVFPYFCGYLGLLLAGWVSDRLVNANFRVLHVRKLMNTIGTLGPGICFYFLSSTNSATGASILLCLALFLGRMSTTGYIVNMLDVGPNHASHIMGVSNTLATIPGIVGNILTGYILHETNDWSLVFNIVGAIFTFGSLPFLLLAKDSSLFVNSGGYSTLSTF